jgi:hypothetical protein
LSGTSRRGAPEKNSKAATWAATHDVASIDSTGRTNMCRQQANTITNAHTRRTRCTSGSSHEPR